MNRTHLLALFDGDKNLLDKFILNFNAESKRLIALMTDYLAESNMEMLANCAHMLKSQTAYGGLDELSALAEQLDRQAKAGEPLHAISDTFETLKKGLQEIITAAT